MNLKPPHVQGSLMSTGTAKRHRPPLVSVIVCTYNRGHLVKRAIASVLAQSYRNWELIIIDDGSVDATARVVLPLVKSDPRIMYCCHANQGLARSRNLGIALASGAYMTFLDSDDEYRAQHLSTRVRAMEKQPSLSLIYGGIEYVGPLEKQYVPDAQRPGKKVHLRDCYAGGTFFARTSTFRTLNGFRNLPFTMDFDFVRRTRRKGLRIAQAEALTYRYHLDSDHRLCDLYEQGGDEAILNFRAR